MFPVSVPAFLVLCLIFLHGIQFLSPVIFQSYNRVFKIQQDSPSLSLKLYKMISQMECRSYRQRCKSASGKLHIQKYRILLITTSLSVMNEILPICIYGYRKACQLAD